MAEDAATVLEHFVNDIANLPAEIAHIYEEIQAKDKLLKEQRDSALARDNSLQKHIRLHGSHVENPKEAVYVEQIRKSQKRVMEIQEEKVALAQKALDLMDKHIKRLDTRITDLIREGLMPPDSIQPSAAPSNLPSTSHHRQPSMRASPSISTHHSRVPSHSSSAHNTPSAQPRSPATTPTFSQLASASRELHEAKRRRLTGPSGGSSAPAVSSNLASSHPSTPGIKSEPAGTRAGTPNTTGSAPKKSVGNRKSAAQAKRDRASASADAEDDDEDEDEDEDEAGEDKRLYCTCQQVSYGNMVACDDSDCPFEWFHWGMFY
ncbi:hypothetical protein RUND412_007319 [Rhizina undulata]